jgi:hypothetical protein
MNATFADKTVLLLTVLLLTVLLLTVLLLTDTLVYLYKFLYFFTYFLKKTRLKYLRVFKVVLYTKVLNFSLSQKVSLMQEYE